MLITYISVPNQLFKEANAITFMGGKREACEGSQSMTDELDGMQIHELHCNWTCCHIETLV